MTWIKGHQDVNTAFDNLDRLSQLNIWADKLAPLLLAHVAGIIK